MSNSGPLLETHDGQVTILTFDTEIRQVDELNVAEIGKELLDVAEKLTKPLLVIDMSSIEFFGSSFIEVLFRVWKRMTVKSGAQLGLVVTQPYCREVLKVTHLDSLWKLFENCQDAANAFNATASGE